MLYKKHPGLLELLRCPQQVVDNYCDYFYIEIEGFGKIPIIPFTIRSFNSYNGDPDGEYGISISNLPPLQDYARGFIDGYKNEFKPFINTEEAKKEAVVRSATKRGSSFTMSKNEDGSIILVELYEYGFYEGERYKAWEIIFQTPNEFIKYFPALKKYEYDKPKVMENYNFWNNIDTTKQGRANIFKGISEDEFIDMIDNADFSSLKKYGISQRVEFNIIVLSRILGKEWEKEALKKQGTRIGKCGKRTGFAEHDKLKGMYLQ
ncbi:hypothetical protein EZS27_016125 [termite gut metagenome]|uniref:Uncharacterized protein n=1 Tax=termite gut metagenome TaxID=433724 RepID=A0A5J4RQ90_9ZZZZ